MFVSALPLAGRDDSILDDIPDTVGARYSCEPRTRNIAVPNAAAPTTTPARGPRVEVTDVFCEMSADAAHASNPEAQPQVFFIAGNYIWQASIIVPSKYTETFDPAELEDGLDGLAALITNALQ